MKNWFCLLFVLILTIQQLKAQRSISLNQALEQARTEQVQLKAQQLFLKQQDALKGAAKGHPAGSVGYGFEELGVAGTGVHSLYFNQSFNAPKIARQKAALQTAIIAVGNRQLKSIELQLERAVAQQYQQILFFKNQQILKKQLLSLYDSIVVLTEKRAKVGEIGQLPLLNIRTAQQQVFLQQLKAEQQFHAELSNLQLLLYDSTIVDIQDSLLYAPLIEKQLAPSTSHPLLLQLQEEQQVLKMRRAVLESQWLPQLDVGVQLQLVDGTFPNAAGQIGWTVPLFKKGLKAQLKGNDWAQQQLLLRTTAMNQQITLEQKKAWQQVQALLKQVQQVERVILPQLTQQQQLLRRAYALGEIDNTTVLQQLQQLLQARQQYLELLLELQFYWIDYKYWGN